MSALVHERCFNHALREAVARCPECSRSYCRECVTEHEDRVLCAACLSRVAARERTQHGWLRRLGQATAIGLGVLFALAFFLLLGDWVVSLPDEFHERTLWSAN